SIGVTSPADRNCHKWRRKVCQRSGLGASTGFEPPVRKPFPNPSPGSSTGFLSPDHDSGPFRGKHEYAVHTVRAAKRVDRLGGTLGDRSRKIAIPYSARDHGETIWYQSAN